MRAMTTYTNYFTLPLNIEHFGHITHYFVMLNSQYPDKLSKTCI